MKLAIRGIASDLAHHYRTGGADANGQPALRRRAIGTANPCRHCLRLIAEGEDKLVLAHRPFDALQPYAESGPIFLHATDCARYDADRMPGWFRNLSPALVRGYDGDDWIRYDTGDVVAGDAIADACARILSDPSIAYVHVRSKFNCFQCRVDRG